MSDRRRMVVLCPYPEGRAPSQRLKYEQYFDDWRAHGWEVDVRPFWDEAAWAGLYRPGGVLTRKVPAVIRGLLRRRRDLRDALRADLVYVHLEASPVGPPVVERALARHGVPLVYDIDDLVHLPHASRANAFMRWLRSPSKITELVTRADEVIVCTAYLADFAGAHNERVTNISSTIDCGAYRPRPHRDRTEGVVIGWSGSHSTSPYLHRLDGVLRELQASDGVRIRVIGDPSFRIPGVELEALPWRRESEVADLSELDVGVYPLPHEEWVLGKSGLKALQYMALEIPPVVERVGTNLEIVEADRNGLLAATEEEWLNALRRLVRDPGLRARLGRAARETVVARYSVRANAPVYRGVLDRALGVSGGTG
ncbi:MAG: glycosyltransferase family 4 protein [Longimicrobiales bacterium]